MNPGLKYGAEFILYADSYDLYDQKNSEQIAAQIKSYRYLFVDLYLFCNIRIVLISKILLQLISVTD